METMGDLEAAAAASEEARRWAAPAAVSHACAALGGAGRPGCQLVLQGREDDPGIFDSTCLATSSAR